MAVCVFPPNAPPMCGNPGLGTSTGITPPAPLSPLRLFTSHATFTSPAPVSSTTTSLYGVVESDGALDPETPPVRLHLGERVRFSLPAIRGAYPALRYSELRLSYRSAAISLEVANPVWRPDKPGTYNLLVGLKANWEDAYGTGTSQSNWEIKLRVTR